jgi:chromate transporter
VKPGFSELTGYFLKLGTIGFGGPIALVNYMHRDLVEKRAWISEAQYRDGLAVAQLAPGPLAAQLATYLGWVRYGVLGATVISIAFILPSLLMVLALSVVYARYGGLPWMTGAFYGIGAAVISLIAISAVRLARKTLGVRPLLWAVFAVNGAFTAITGVESIWVLVLSGLLVLVIDSPATLTRRRTMVFAPALLIALAGAPLWLTILGFFAQASLVVFGSGLAIVPFLHGGVVEQFHWLTDRQFLDAIAVSMITPGPVVITVAFIGYLVHGFTGAGAAALGMFLPMYLVVVLVAPFYGRVRDNRAVQAFVLGVTAGAIGALAGAVVIIAQRALIDTTTIAIAFAALLLILQSRVKIPDPVLIVFFGLVGVVISSR